MQTFFCESDYASYREWVAEGCKTAGAEILAYCLMPNHVHFIVVPSHADALRFALAGAHRRYTSFINKRQHWQGHLWQERFHSFPMDDEHTLAAIRYVELNPVRARLADTAGDWAWSSARAHLTGTSDGMVEAALRPPLDRVGAWSNFLKGPDCPDQDEQMRIHSQNGKPLGCRHFVSKLEHMTGKDLQVRSRGRPTGVGDGRENRNCLI